MICPRCHTTDMNERDRDGVTIDVCPSCRGVWLDRGELDKLIARSVEDRREDRRGRDDDDDDDYQRRSGHKRRSWFDIFD